MNITQSHINVAVELLQKEKKTFKKGKPTRYSKSVKQMCVNIATHSDTGAAQINKVIPNGTLNYWLKTIKPTEDVVREEYTDVVNGDRIELVDTVSVVPIEEQKEVAHGILVGQSDPKFFEITSTIEKQIRDLEDQLHLIRQLKDKGFDFSK